MSRSELLFWAHFHRALLDLERNQPNEALTRLTALAQGTAGHAVGMVAVMWAIRRHYLRMEGAQRPETPLDPREVHPRIVVPIAKLNVPARQALAFANSIAGGRPVVAVHVTDDLEAAERIREEWQSWPQGEADLVVIESPYRSLAGPLLRYIDALHEVHPDETLVVVLPEYVPTRWWEHLLHNHTALRLKATLLFHPGVIVANVPYHLE